MAYIVFIRGVPERIDVNVRDKPGLAGAVAFRVLKEAQATCSEVRLDLDNTAFQGQIYRWFRLKFNDGQEGWVRDDLIDLQGDCSPFGYSNYPARVIAFSVSKSITLQPGAPPVVTTTTTTTTGPVGSSTTTAGGASPAAPPPAGCDATVRRDIAAKLRADASIASAQVALLNPNTAVRILGVEPGKDGQNFRWCKVSVNGTQGYIREDLLAYTDDCAGFGLVNTAVAASATSGSVNNTSVRFNSPIKGAYAVFQEFGANRHKGTDLAAAPGLSVVACGPGIVAYTMKCTRCTATKPNFAAYGLPAWDAASIRDPAWGYGFGNHVVLRYAWADLPSAMRADMTAQNLAGAYAYVIHAHLSRIDVADGAQVSNGTVLGLLGNTGNSTGPHLHLEIRASFASNERDIFNRIVINPRSLYQF